MACPMVASDLVYLSESRLGVGFNRYTTTVRDRFEGGDGDHFHDPTKDVTLGRASPNCLQLRPASPLT